VFLKRKRARAPNFHLQSKLLVEILLNHLLPLGSRAPCSCFRLGQSRGILAILFCYHSTVSPLRIPLLTAKIALLCQDSSHFLVSLLLLFRLHPVSLLILNSASDK
jgi:hypothetical protein